MAMDIQGDRKGLIPFNERFKVMIKFSSVEPDLFGGEVDEWNKWNKDREKAYEEAHKKDLENWR